MASKGYHITPKGIFQLIVMEARRLGERDEERILQYIKGLEVVEGLSPKLLECFQVMPPEDFHNMVDEFMKNWNIFITEAADD